MKSKLYIICKTVLYRILSIIGNTVFLYLLIGDVRTAGKFAIAVAVFHFVFYYLFENLATKYEEKYIYRTQDET